jgi:hypothetical protein
VEVTAAYHQRSLVSGVVRFVVGGRRLVVYAWKCEPRIVSGVWFVCWWLSSIVFRRKFCFVLMNKFIISVPIM